MSKNEISLFSHPHRRYNALTGDWILVSPQRQKRPWQGQVEKKDEEDPDYFPDCYLCPGNFRAKTGSNPAPQNPNYESIFWFANDFPALMLNDEKSGNGDMESYADESDILKANLERGICRVICFSPKHNLSLAKMDLKSVKIVVDSWTDHYRELASIDHIGHVQIFENRGSMMGCSNQHPHCQIWAQEHPPLEVSKETKQQEEYYKKHNCKCLLCTYVRQELEDGSRVVCRHGNFVVLVPFWAKWPFETLVLPVHHLDSLLVFSDSDRIDFASSLKDITDRFERVFDAPFPYSMGIHQSPTDGSEYGSFCHLHVHFYPPLLRSATVRKFMVGYEMMGEPQRDLTPESAADLLRSKGSNTMLLNECEA